MFDDPEISPAQRVGEPPGERFARLSPARREALDAPVEEVHQADFYYRQLERREWAEAQRARAPEVLALLRAHVPAERWPEVEEFLSTGYGRDCLGDILKRGRGLCGDAVPRPREDEEECPWEECPWEERPREGFPW